MGVCFFDFTKSGGRMEYPDTDEELAEELAEEKWRKYGGI